MHDPTPPAAAPLLGDAFPLRAAIAAAAKYLLPSIESAAKATETKIDDLIAAVLRAVYESPAAQEWLAGSLQEEGAVPDGAMPITVAMPSAVRDDIAARLPEEHREPFLTGAFDQAFFDRILPIARLLLRLWL